MPAATTRAALAVYLAPLRRTIQCVARAEVFGAGHSLDHAYDVSFLAHGGGSGNSVPLRSRSGQLEILFTIREWYQIVPVAPTGGRRQYVTRVAYYAYTVRDRDERDLLAYHWHPEGVSHVTTPHLHIPRHAPIPLPRTDPARAVSLGEMHLPTNRVFLEDVVELLISEFSIAPLHADWRDALAESRAQHDRERD